MAKALIIALHSTMFLLKRKVRFRLKYRYLLYIPQCFY